VCPNLSSPPNPFLESSPPGTEVPPADLQTLPPGPAPAENPVWSGWEVLALAALGLTTVVVFLFAVTFLAHRFLYPNVPLTEVAKYPGLIVSSQLLAYVVILGFMYIVVRRDHGQDFWQAIRWNWPQRWTGYALLGVLLSIGLQALAHFLPIPKKLPMDQFFQTTREAYLLSIFGVTFAPLLEELFFRGFLYPVLARRLGTAVGIFLTALGFAAIHGAQLMYSWGPVLIIFIVGLVLTTVRAITKSVAAGLLIHMSYNGAISLLMFVATGGFRHLERLNQ
jgi:uncharacterized protein